MYWPNKQSLQLNLEVSDLFIQTYNKFFINLKNKTQQKLPSDIFTASIKRSIFLNILIELEIILLDIIELNLTRSNINKINHHLLYNLINKIIYKFIKKNETKNQENNINLQYQYNQFFFYENIQIFKNLLIYLIFGSQYIELHTFKFRCAQTPKYHVKVLFENLIIQTSNIIIFNILEQDLSQLSTFSSFSDYQMPYKSIRSISNFQNNLLSSNWINTYIYYPQNIYCNQYQAWLLSSHGLIFKYIYINRYYEYLRLSTSQMLIVTYIELQDFILPKLNLFIILLGKLIIYILLEIINKSIKILINQIIIKINRNNYTT